MGLAAEFIPASVVLSYQNHYFALTCEFCCRKCNFTIILKLKFLSIRHMETDL